ncbi:hypothetical protein, partial [Dolichospermum circinale]|uniref:hypothetical protein n=1 Tax=Dolichospermum circinale TaxID=109265 RepID=UPI0018CBCE38
TSKSYQYNRATGKLEPVNPNLEVVSITIDNKKYCVLPHPSLTSKSYQYNRATGKLEPVDPNLELIKSWEVIN